MLRSRPTRNWPNNSAASELVAPLQTATGIPAPRGILGDLVNSPLCGFWADRTELPDSVEFARKLRAQVDVELHSGYIMARMRYAIEFAPEAVQDLKRLKARVRAEVQDALERHLRYEPAKVSKSRIKRLRKLTHPQFRLMVGEIRVFYDITEYVVEILAIVPKSEAISWLEERGE